MKFILCSNILQKLGAVYIMRKHFCEALQGLGVQGNLFFKKFRNILVENIFDNFFCQKQLCLTKIVLPNIFLTKHFLRERDFTFPSTPYFPPLHTTPTSSYLLFEVEGGDKRTNLQTGRTHILSLLLYQIFSVFESTYYMTIAFTHKKEFIKTLDNIQSRYAKRTEIELS